MRKFRSYGVALLIIIVVGAWMATGVIVAGGNGPGKGEAAIIGFVGEGAPTEDEGGHDGETDDPALTIAQRNEQTQTEVATHSVRVKTYTAQPMPITIDLRGRTEAKASVSVVAQTAGIVESIAVSKGDMVSPGDTLCTIDKGTREATLAQAEAALEQAKLNYETNKSLREKDLAAANTAASYEASLKAAEAALKQARTDLDNTEITTEVAGIVQDPITEVGSLLSIGSVCATVVQLDPIVFAGSIPEAHIGYARTGLPVTVTTVTGQEADGVVSYISATADSATHTFAVEVELPNADYAIRDGLTAEATVNVGTVPAHLLPQSVLTLNDDGAIGVRTVVDGVVQFFEVTIVNDTRDGVWVTGLPTEIDVITLGQEYVQAGQHVETETEEEGSAS